MISAGEGKVWKELDALLLFVTYNYHQYLEVNDLAQWVK